MSQHEDNVNSIPQNRWMLDLEDLDFIISNHFIITLHYQRT